MQSEHLKVTGIACSGCYNKVMSALNAISGVGHATVSLSSGDVTVEYDERQTTPAQLTLALQEAGYGVVGAAEPARRARGCCCQ